MNRDPNERRTDSGPFDIIGDVHGCADELGELIDLLWHNNLPVADEEGPRPPPRRVVFLGDLCDRGPENIRVLEIVFAMIEEADALWIRGNHDRKLWKLLTDQTDTMYFGMQTTARELVLPDGSYHPICDRFIRHYEQSAYDHLVLDEGRLVLAHGGLTEALHGKHNADAREEAVYGPGGEWRLVNGVLEWFDWTDDYRGEAAVVYGHAHVEEAAWKGNTICLDTDCVFGKKLTALRWPEREIVQVQAAKVYWPASAEEVEETT